MTTANYVSFIDTDEEKYTRKLKEASLPAFAISVFPDFAKDLKNHQLKITTDDLQTLLGRKPPLYKKPSKKYMVYDSAHPTVY